MRRQIFCVIVGAQGCGKTSEAFKLIKVFEKQGKPILCVIPDDEEKQFWQIEEIETDDESALIHELRNFKSGIRKIYCEDVKLFDIIRAYFRNGLIVIDDARVYLGSRDKPFRSLIMRRRQKNCDIIFICHGLSEIPPSCNSFITDIILFEIGDDYETWNVANKKMYVPIVARINSIARTKNKYYSERISLRSIKI